MSPHHDSDPASSIHEDSAEGSSPQRRSFRIAIPPPSEGPRMTSAPGPGLPRPAHDSPSPTTKSERTSSGATTTPHSTESYELTHVPSNNSNALVEESSFKQQSPLTTSSSTMSRVPLLLRTAPALGTGSYGGMPTYLFGSSSESSTIEDVDGVTIDGTSKGKDPMRKSEPSAGPSSLAEEYSNTQYTRSDAVLEHPKARKRKGKSSGSRKLKRAVSEAVEGQQEGGLEGRFNDSAGDGPPGYSGMSYESGSDHAISDPEDDADSMADVNDKRDDEDPPDNSPFAQVRASVPATDDITLSINTPRMWFLSMLFALLGSSTNLFFSLRYPSVSITPVIALLLVHPLGLLWDRLLKRSNDPAETFHDGTMVQRRDENGLLRPEVSTRYMGRGRRLRLWLAQGRWNEKEHACVYISSNVSFGFALATDVIVEQTMFYHQELGITYQVLFILSTQILGYALAGVTRRYLVRPSGMIWPGTLISTAMFTTLHKNENEPADGWKVSRWRFFLYVFLGGFAFYFLPGLLFPALSYFNVITWFAPKNVVVANLFGVSSGLGLFPLTFDWSQIAYIGSPLITPFWAALNVVGGLVVVMWIIAPIMYYCNVLYSSYMPILSAAVFDNTGKPYDVSKILTSDFLFDNEAYHKYSPVFLPITYVLSYGVQFAGLSALITHTACWHGKDIWKQWRKSLEEVKHGDKGEYQSLATSNGHTGGHARISTDSSRSPGMENIMSGEDVHSRLMRRYTDVPLSWYLITFLSMTAIGIFVVEYYPVHLPWYGLLLALAICAIMFIPIGIVMAITNQQSSIWLICQLICGFLFPGRPVANMVFVTYGYITSTQGLKFSSDLKLGQYMKIPPRLLFSLQMAATVVSSLTQIGVLNWMLSSIPGICTPQALNGFTCPIARVHFNGSILWGVLGPTRFFGPGAMYRPLVWAFLIGAVAPLPIYYLARKRGRKSVFNKVNLPVLLGSLSWIPPATGLNFSVWAVVCFLFNYLLKKRKTAWWSKYNMTLSAALDSGLAFGVLVVFFGFLYPGWMEGFSWWGTEVFKQGCDWRACSYLKVDEGKRFGPGVW